MTLSFLLTLRDPGDDLLPLCRSLAAVLLPGDEVVVVDCGSGDGTVVRLAQFTREGGWPHGIVPDVTALEKADPARALALARGRAGQPHALRLAAGDRLCPDGVAQLRQAVAAGPDLILCNSAWHLGSGLGVLPCADAARWPDSPGSLAPDMLPDLMPEARRLVGPKAGDDYDQAMSETKTLWLVPRPVLLRPLPAQMDLTVLAGIVPAVLAQPKAGRAACLARHLTRLEDGLALLHPDQGTALLIATEAMLAALPWSLRKQALARMPLLAALSRGGHAAAMTSLLQVFASADRARLTAAITALAGLRRDIDVTLPGPDYLMVLFEKARGG